MGSCGQVYSALHIHPFLAVASIGHGYGVIACTAIRSLQCKTASTACAGYTVSNFIVAGDGRNNLVIGVGHPIFGINPANVKPAAFILGGLGFHALHTAPIFRLHR